MYNRLFFNKYMLIKKKDELQYLQLAFNTNFLFISLT